MMGHARNLASIARLHAIRHRLPMPRRRLTLVAYDIACSKRRAKALKAVRAFGLDGQKSAHECALSEAERTELETRLRGIIDEKTDRLMITALDPRTKIRALKQNTPAEPAPYFYVG